MNFATGNGGDLIIMGTGDAELEIKESEIDVDGRFTIAFVNGNIKLEDDDDGFRVNGKFVIETMLGDIVVENNDVLVYLQDFEIESEGGDVIVEGNHNEGGAFVEIQSEGDGSVRVAENDLTVVGDLVVESAGPAGVTFHENVLDIDGCLEIESDAEGGGSGDLAGEVHVKENYVIDIVLGVEIGAKNFNGSPGVCVSEDNFGSTVGGNGVDLNGACGNTTKCIDEVP